MFSSGCGTGTTEQIAECIKQAKDFIGYAKPFVEVVIDLVGVGTLALVGMLVWMLKRLRNDLEGQTGANEALGGALKDAVAERDDALSRARTAETLVSVLEEQLKASTAPLDKALKQTQEELSGLRVRLQNASEAGRGDGAQFWSRAVGARLDGFEQAINRSKPIILFANQKGGVGKTTLAANISAAFSQKGEKVLVVDLDYQGSLTSLMLAKSTTRGDDFPSDIDLLFNDSLPEFWPKLAIKAHSDNLHYISCWYSFEKLERNLEYRWILQDTDDDIRYRLARALLSEQVQNQFDRIIIDAPPRMTTGFLNGFCTATHLFVPTVVDGVSAVAVGTFSHQFRELRAILNPSLELAGIVGTMTTLRNTQGPFTLPQAALSAAASAERRVRRILNSNKDFFVRQAVMGRTARVSYSAEDGIAYLQAAETRPMFDAIAEQVALRAPRRP